MKVGIDSYCFHRFFGEVYPEQEKPSKQMTVEDFLKRANELEVDGVSLQTCFLPRFDKEYLSELKGMLDEYQFDRVWAWGHPTGLDGGRNMEHYEDMLRNIEYAKEVGARVMRVAGSDWSFRFEPKQPMIEMQSKLFSDAAKIAKRYDVKLADENHIEFNSNEMLTLVNNVNSPYFGITFDTGNFIRLLDDPVQSMEKLAKHVYATHIKDVKPQKGAPVNEWYFFSSTPSGEGVVDIQKIAQLLKDNGYEGFLAIEVDFLHSDYNNDEDSAVAASVKEMRRIISSLK